MCWTFFLPLLFPFPSSHDHNRPVVSSSRASHGSTCRYLCCTESLPTLARPTRTGRNLASELCWRIFCFVFLYISPLIQCSSVATSVGYENLLQNEEAHCLPANHSVHDCKLSIGGGVVFLHVCFYFTSPVVMPSDALKGSDAVVLVRDATLLESREQKSSDQNHSL